MAFKWYLLYEKIALRKLDFYRTNQTIGSVDKFMKKTIGKRFKISLNKLMRKKESGKVGKKEETYFCSELIAELYKHVGLLPNNKISSQYWPINFSSAKKLDLLKGASLGNEIIIDFNEVLEKFKR